MSPILKKGDKVGIISPSRWLDSKESIEMGLDYLKGLGLQPIIGKHVFDNYRYMAGTPQDRAEDIMNFYKDPSIKAMFCSAGGDGSQMILPLLDYNIIKNNPKPIFGFSDSTALQLGIYAKTKQPFYTGFVLTNNFITGAIDQTVDYSLKNIINHKPITAIGGTTVNPGKAEGILIGGCLSLFRNLCGTEFYPDLSDAILLIEDEYEMTYKLDLMLNQIRQNPNFDKIRGIVFGNFYNCTIRRDGDGSIDDMIHYFTKDLKIPVIKDLAYGHEQKRYILSVGKKCKLDADKGTLEYMFE